MRCWCIMSMTNSSPSSRSQHLSDKAHVTYAMLPSVPVPVSLSCREHALRKRRTRSARHHWQRTVAAAALGAWRQLEADAAMFRGVLVDVGQRMQAGLLSEAFQGWRDVLQAKQWKAAAMMRWVTADVV